MKPSDEASKSLRIGDLVRIYRRGRTWYANYQQDGKQHRPSLRTRIKKEAIARGEKLERDLEMGRRPRKLVRVSIEQAAGSFLEAHKIKERAKGTISHYATYVMRFAAFMAERKRTWLGDIDHECIDLFRGSLRGNVDLWAIYHHVCAVRSLVLFAVQRGYLESDPLPGFHNPKPKSAKQQPYWTWTQARQILELISDDYRGLFELLAYTGMRIGEAIHLQPRDIDLESCVIHIRAKPDYDWKPKTGEARIIPICDELLPMIASLDRNTRWVFVRPTKTGRKKQLVINERSTLSELKRVLTELKLDRRGRHHTFRHTFISHALMRGVPEATVRLWVGHVDPAIIRLYTHIADQISQSQMRTLFKNNGA